MSEGERLLKIDIFLVLLSLLGHGTECGLTASNDSDLLMPPHISWKDFPTLVWAWPCDLLWSMNQYQNI